MVPEISVIVPVYNAEKYLRRCIDSILEQEFTDFELILVDDGSTDTSGEICEEYAERDGRVRVFHKENSGVSDARNLGMEAARGTYLQFADSDDGMTRDAMKLMVRTAREKGCDLVISDFYRVVGELVSHKGDIEENRALSREEFAAYMMENPADYYYGVLWNKLYRRELVEKYRLRMNSELSWCEDFLFNLEYILHAESFCALRAPVYYYVKTKGSLVSQNVSISKTVKMKLMMFEYYSNFYKHVLDEEDYEKNRRQLYRFLLSAAGDGLVFPAVMPGTKKLGEERVNVIREAVFEDGVILEAYRNRKLLERYLEPAAIKHGLSMTEMFLLLLLKQSERIFSRKELAELSGVSRSSMAFAVQRLAAKGLIKAEEAEKKRGEERKLRIQALPAAGEIQAEAAAAVADYDAARFLGFEDGERREYERLDEKIRENVKKALE